nr:CBS domain-containing protein [uncultured Caldimonas sp.]
MEASLTAGAVCSRKVETTFRQVVVSEAARQMRDRHVGCLVVVEESEAGLVPIGLLTDRDIVTGIVAKEVDPGLLRVGDVVSDTLFTVREEDSVLDVLGAMRRRGVRRLPVTTPRGTLVGIVTLDDVLGVVADELAQMVQAMRHGREQEVARRA